MKCSFFQAAVASILLYGCTTWTLTKRLEKKLDGNYIRMLRAILNKSWRPHPTRHQLYGHLPPITKTIQVRRTRHAGHCWRSRDELISDVLLWTPTHGRAKAGRPARTYIQQQCEDTGCSPEDLPEAMNDREKLRERVRDICASNHHQLFIFVSNQQVPACCTSALILTPLPVKWLKRPYYWPNMYRWVKRITLNYLRLLTAGLLMTFDIAHTLTVLKSSIWFLYTFSKALWISVNAIFSALWYLMIHFCFHILQNLAWLLFNSY